MTKIINMAIGAVLVAIVAGVGMLAYLQMRTDPNANSVLERDREKWQQQVDENPSNHLARANLGAIYLDMGDTDQAIKELTISLDQEPESFTYMSKLGDAYMKDGNYDAAIGLFLRSADLLPTGEKYSGYYKAAEASLAKGDNSAAKDFAEKSVADSDLIWNSHMLLGGIYEQEGDLTRARDEYQKAAKFNPYDKELQDAITRVTA